MWETNFFNQICNNRFLSKRCKKYKITLLITYMINAWTCYHTHCSMSTGWREIHVHSCYSIANLCVYEQSTNMTSQCQYLAAFAWRQRLKCGDVLIPSQKRPSLPRKWTKELSMIVPWQAIISICAEQLNNVWIETSICGILIKYNDLLSR